MISILMPIYNGIEFIDESVPTVINQTYMEWELIIGINGHEKDSEVYNIAKKYENEKIKVLELDTKGKSNSLNEMIKLCKYDWVALLDVDDKWFNNKLENQVQYMKDYDVIGTFCQYFGDMSGKPKLPKRDLTRFNFNNYNPVINSSCLVKKELCWWDQNCFTEDYDLWKRLKNKNKKFYNVPKILVLHRIHKESAFNSKTR